MTSFLKKTAQYSKYIAKHKWFVFVECAKMGLFRRGIVHDASKLLLDEWIPYRDFFYGKKNEEGYFHKPGTDQAFDEAWLRHIHRNPHHWQYWLLQEDDGPVKALKMPREFLLEMIADWRGAGKAQGFATINAWYAMQREKIVLHPDTRVELEQILRDAGELD